MPAASETVSAPLRPFGALRGALLESPVWDARAGRLLVADVRGGRIVALADDGAVAATWDFGDVVGSFGLAHDARWVVALRDEVVLFDPATGMRETLAVIERDLATTRLNDGKIGPDGAFWVGTMDDSPARAPIGGLYRVTRAGATRVAAGIAVSNGLAWSHDGRVMFHADSRAARIDAWAFDSATGALGERRVFAALNDTLGRADGAATDVAGRYWSAGVSSGRLHVWGADGALAASVPVGTGAPTMMAFGGGDLRDLFVTSLRREGDADPRAGGLFRARADAPGVAVSRFRA